MSKKFDEYVTKRIHELDFERNSDRSIRTYSQLIPYRPEYIEFYEDADGTLRSHQFMLTEVAGDLFGISRLLVSRIELPVLDYHESRSLWMTVHMLRVAQ